MIAALILVDGRDRYVVPWLTTIGVIPLVAPLSSCCCRRHQTNSRQTLGRGLQRYPADSRDHAMALQFDVDSTADSGLWNPTPGFAASASRIRSE